MTTHSFDTKDAEKHGVESAVILYNLRHWLEKNKANGKHEHDGFFWTYNSAAAFEKLFPYMNRRTISRNLQKLMIAGVVVIGNYNQKGYDRTQWYTIPMEFASTSNDSSNDTIGQNVSAIGQNVSAIGQNVSAIGQNVSPIPDINTNNKPDSKQERDTPKPEPVIVEKAAKAIKEKPAKFVKPDLAEIIGYCLEMSFAAQSGEAFHDYFESIGWLVGGKTTMRDWKAALRNWMRREGSFAPRANKAKKEQITKWEMPDEWRGDDSNAINSTATVVNSFIAIGA